ncbi:MAG: hypothetical protein KJO01_01095 [Gammaproteobacteria bacterium]|nr:hypothetical protein [Gammaproteobacteria bacterium]MBT8109963.1 hypothetical protein [Gammaproteobacteria bacterium]NND47300.1 membrane lipoprotein lipid attachment site-containing protein [Woeseiaceae bacterium]NNL44665.1 membrane lipoprotein lipid attachment site-containing protein [Woeseiaceae bacterium]
MKRILLTASLAFLVSACATPPDLREKCPDNKGRYTVTLSYGEGGITIAPKKKVKRKSILVIKLDADKKFEEAKVTTKGVSVTPTTPTPPDKSWLDDDGTEKADKRLIYCVPSTPAGVIYTYKYSVDIDGLGYLDPRIEVTW